MYTYFSITTGPGLNNNKRVNEQSTKTTTILPVLLPTNHLNFWGKFKKTGAISN
jgi:hypothetical protein